MNAFFAACEQQANPALRGRPVGVAPYTGDTGCVIASSYEAKRLGVPTATSVGEARRKIPGIVIVESDPPKYRAVHEDLLKILARFAPFTVKSIDEFAMKLHPDDRPDVLSLAFKIKQAIRSEIGEWFTASVGVGPNQFYAKLAAGMQKPDGLVEISEEGIPAALSQLKLTRLPGINVNMERRLNMIGVYTPFEFYKTPAQNLRQAFGIWGDAWYLRLRGHEVDEIETKRRTIGHSHVLSPYFRTPSRALSVLRKLVERAVIRIREEGFMAKGVHLSVRFLDHPAWGKGHKVAPFQDGMTFYSHAYRLWQESPGPRSRPLLIAVSSFDLVPAESVPLSLFPTMTRKNSVAKTMDLVNSRFGDFAVFPADMIGAEKAAPNRIPWGRIPTH
jgi:DNA polymerase-4